MTMQETDAEARHNEGSVSGPVVSELERAVGIIVEWVGRQPLIRRVFIYGSRVRGTQRPDSDLDVALEFDRGTYDGNCLATWICKAKSWRAELQPKLPWTLHLEWHDPSGGTPHVAQGLEESSMLVYERADLGQRVISANPGVAPGG